MSDFSSHKSRTSRWRFLVQSAYIQHYMANDPKHLYVEGLIDYSDLEMALKYRYRLTESAIDQEYMNEWVGAVAKAMGKIAIEVGKVGVGVGKGIFQGLVPIAKKLGSEAVDVAMDAKDWTVKNTGGVIDGVKKFVGNTVKGSKEAFATLADMAANGSNFKDMAQEAPEAYLLAFKELTAKIKSMELPTDPKEAAGALGAFETKEGKKALKYGAEKAGVSPEEMKTLLKSYVGKAKFVEIAVKAKEDASNEPEQEDGSDEE